MRTKHSHILKSSAVFLLVAAVMCLNGTASAGTLTFKSARDCNANAIISCGALSNSQLIKAYKADSYTQKVYAYFGISASDINNMPMNAVAGHVDKRGNIYRGSSTTPAASDTITAQRQSSSDSKRVTSQGATLYIRPLNQAQTSSSADAFVVMGKRGFDYAIIASNGDPVITRQPVVTATPKRTAPNPAPAAPKPKPKTTAPAPQTTPAPAATPPAAPAAEPSASTPDQLANTGPMSAAVAVISGLSVVLGALAAYYYYQLRKLRTRG